MSRAGLLETTRHLKPWGRTDLPVWANCGSGESVGEIWFDPPEPLLEILAKYLFTDAKLSVQVHPTAENSPTGAGKDECWLVTEAEPGASLALGFRDEYAPDEIRRSALDGSIQDMLDWREVKKNDFFYVPAGTVHAIGPGLTIVEIQQNTDITHRLYDYGRDRGLHLDDAMASIRCGPHPGNLTRSIEPEAGQLLVDGPYFAVAQIVGTDVSELSNLLHGAVQVLPLVGSCHIAGYAIASGNSGWSEGLGWIDFSDNRRCLAIARPSPAVKRQLLP